MIDLIESIKREQDKRQLSDSKLARLLGIDISTWSRIKRGLRPPGGKFLRAVARNLPELHDSMLIYLSNPTTLSERAQNGKRGLLKHLGDILYFRLKGWFCYPKATAKPDRKD